MESLTGLGDAPDGPPDERVCWCGMDHRYMDMDADGNWVEYPPEAFEDDEEGTDG